MVGFILKCKAKGGRGAAQGWPQTHDPSASAFPACSTSVCHHNQVLDFNVTEAKRRREKEVGAVNWGLYVTQNKAGHC